MAVTGTFGLRLWNGTYWENPGMSGIDVDIASGRYGMIASLTSVDDTLAFSWAWGKGIWIRKGTQAGWSLIEHGAGDQIAWAEGAYWAWKSYDTLETSKSGSTWKPFTAPFHGYLHGADGQLVITDFFGSRLARKQGDAFRVDSLVGTFPSYGSYVISHPSGVMAMTSAGVFLLGTAGTYELPFAIDTTAPWIGSVLLVGNRVFATRNSGLWTTTLPTQIQAGLGPRARSLWQTRFIREGMEVNLPKSARVQFSWYDLTGARRGGSDRVLAAGKHSLLITDPSRGTKIVRIAIDGVQVENGILIVQ